ncbi:MAG: hypothetical protein HWN81_00790 [Candidatus Lokiarchaeota archaeon]|nr:hypothetical protein [Candidatus Lokiarchaeota archaeon]
MKKKNIGFILFGIAGLEIITGLISFFVFLWINERLGLPISRLTIIFRITLTFSITISIPIIVGLILVIKFRNE